MVSTVVCMDPSSTHIEWPSAIRVPCCADWLSPEQRHSVADYRSPGNLSECSLSSLTKIAKEPPYPKGPKYPDMEYMWFLYGIVMMVWGICFIL